MNYIKLLLPLLLLFSCELERSDNGDLDGFWLLTRADTLSTGATADVRASRVYWAFQGRLLQARIDRDIEGVYFFFQHRQDSLILLTPYLSKREEGDVPIDDAQDLFGYGIHAIPARFFVEKLTSSSMVLVEDDRYRLHFTKY